MPASRFQALLGLALFLVVSFLPAWAGSLFMPDEWYARLEKPSWNPPNWVFGPVWTLLYISMAVAAWLVWRQAGLCAAALPLAMFAVQLALNGAWTWLFFGLHNPALAFADIVLLWAAILVTALLFWPVRPLAGALLLPYLAWVSFAASLNFALWRMNP